MKVIVLEGHSGAGKTTTAGQLCVALTQRGLRVRFLPEHGHYLNPLLGEWVRNDVAADVQLPGGDTVWLDIERQRMAELGRAREEGFDVAIVDTSLLSVAAYELARQAVGLGPPDRALLMAIDAYLRSAQPRCAAFWVFVRAPAETVLQRLHQRGGARKVLASETAIHALDEFRRRFAQCHLPAGSRVEVKSPVDICRVLPLVLSGRAPSAEQERQALLEAVSQVLLAVDRPTTFVHAVRISAGVQLTGPDQRGG